MARILHIREAQTTSANGWAPPPAASVIVWSVVGSIVLLLALWLVGGHIHATLRVRKGKQPLWYHKVSGAIIDHCRSSLTIASSSHLRHQAPRPSCKISFLSIASPAPASYHHAFSLVGPPPALAPARVLTGCRRTSTFLSCGRTPSRYECHSQFVARDGEGSGVQS